MNHTILALTVITLVQIITAQCTQMNTNASHTILMIKLMLYFVIFDIYMGDIGNIRTLHSIIRCY